MQYAVAVLAVPSALKWFDGLATDQAFQVARVNLHNLLLALRNVHGHVQVAFRSL